MCEVCEATSRVQAELMALRRDRALAPVVDDLTRVFVGHFGAEYGYLRRELRALRGRFDEALRKSDVERYVAGLAALQTIRAGKAVAALIKRVERALRIGHAHEAERLLLSISFDVPQPRAVAWLTEHCAEMVKRIDDTTRDRVASIVTQAVEEGWSYTKTEQALKDLYDGFRKSLPQQHILSRARLIAVNEAAMGYTQGELELGRWLAEGGLAVEKGWLTVMDERTCEVCSGNEGESWIPLAQAFADGSEGPPAHPACVPGSTRVLGEEVLAATERLYDGDLIVIGTASGYELSCTPNHPILTPLGWVPAGLINEGSHIVCSSVSDWLSLRDPDHKDAPATIEQVARAFRQSREVAACEVEVAAEDFHGDGFGSEVAVVATDGLLRNSRNATVKQHLLKNQLSGADTATVALSGARCLASLLFARLATACRLVGGLRVAPVLCGAALEHHVTVSFCDAANRHACLTETTQYHNALHAVRLRERILRLSLKVAANKLVNREGNAAALDALGSSRSEDASLLQVEADRCAADPAPLRDLIDHAPCSVVIEQVTHKSVTRFCDHVFNLQTRDGYYFANGIVTHNCRCVLETRVAEDPIAKRSAA